MLRKKSGSGLSSDLINCWVNFSLSVHLDESHTKRKQQSISVNVLRNRKEVASGREDRELPHVIELIEALDQRDKFMHSIGSQRLEGVTAAIAKLFSQLFHRDRTRVMPQRRLNACFRALPVT